MRRTSDADASIGNNIDIIFRTRGEAMLRIRAQIHFMMLAGNGQRLRQFPGAGAKSANIVNAAALPHQLEAMPWLDRAKQNKTVLFSLHQDIQHPMNAVVEVDISRARFVSLDKTARARSSKGMSCFVTDCCISFNFNNDPRATAPNQFRANEFARAGQRVTLEKRSLDDLAAAPASRESFYC